MDLFLLFVVAIILITGFFLTKMASSGGGGDSSLGMNIVIAGICKKFPSVKSVSTSELQTAVQSGEDSNREHLILDVREKNEFDVSHLVNSSWIDESLQPEEKVDAVKDIISEKAFTKPTDVYVYCSVGYRSSALVEHLLKSPELKALHDTNFYNITGGIFKWANENRMVVTDAGERTELVHPYNSFFGKLLHKSHRYKIKKS